MTTGRKVALAVAAAAALVAVFTAAGYLVVWFVNTWPWGGWVILGLVGFVALAVVCYAWVEAWDNAH